MKVDEFHYHEVLDRLHVIMTNIDTHIVEHPVMEKHTELRDKTNDAIGILWDVYQEIGKLSD